MKAFYEELVKERGSVSKAEALARAQIKLLKGTGQGKAEFAHPYIWAPFV